MAVQKLILEKKIQVRTFDSQASLLSMKEPGRETKRVKRGLTKNFYSCKLLLKLPEIVVGSAASSIYSLLLQVI